MKYPSHKWQLRRYKPKHAIKTFLARAGNNGIWKSLCSVTDEVARGVLNAGNRNLLYLVLTQ